MITPRSARASKKEKTSEQRRAVLMPYCNQKLGINSDSYHAEVNRRACCK